MQILLSPVVFVRENVKNKKFPNCVCGRNRLPGCWPPIAQQLYLAVRAYVMITDETLTVELRETRMLAWYSKKNVINVLHNRSTVFICHYGRMMCMIYGMGFVYFSSSDRERKRICQLFILCFSFSLSFVLFMVTFVHKQRWKPYEPKWTRPKLFVSTV